MVSTNKHVSQSRFVLPVAVAIVMIILVWSQSSARGPTPVESLSDAHDLANSKASSRTSPTRAPSAEVVSPAQQCKNAVGYLDQVGGFGLSFATSPEVSIEFRLAEALQPLLCQGGWLTGANNVVIDIGVNMGKDLSAWFRMFGATPPEEDSRVVGLCPSAVTRFLLVEPQKEYEADVAIAIEAEAARRRAARYPPLTHIATVQAMVGAQRHAGKDVRLIGEGEIAMAELDETEELRLRKAEARARRRAEKAARGSSAAPERRLSWIEQRARTATVVSLRDALEKAFGSEFDFRVPFLKIDAEGSDSVILMDSKWLFRAPTRRPSCLRSQPSVEHVYGGPSPRACDAQGDRIPCFRGGGHVCTAVGLRSRPQPVEWCSTRLAAQTGRCASTQRWPAATVSRVGFGSRVVRGAVACGSGCARCGGVAPGPSRRFPSLLPGASAFRHGGPSSDGVARKLVDLTSRQYSLVAPRHGLHR
jgi:hypothetical protein